MGEDNSHGVLDCLYGIFSWEELIHCNLFVFILLICQCSRFLTIRLFTFLTIRLFTAVDDLNVTLGMSLYTI